MMNGKYWILVLVLALALAACGGGSSDSAGQTTGSGGSSAQVVAGDPANGESAYQQNCSACHGPDATGIEGLGKDLTASTFINDLSDPELLEFVKKGRPVGDPLNTTGIDMPPKGGNPALSDAHIMDIIAYLRSIHD